MSPRCLAYLRVSSKGQIDGDGFDRQMETIDRWAAVHQAAVMGVFREEGVSGTAGLLERPALIRLVNRISDGGVDSVLVEKADRLARDLVESELLLRQFSELGVRVIECEGGSDLTAGDGDNPTAKLVRQILGAVAEFEKSALVSKLRRARGRVRAERGRCEGAKPYGAKPGEEKVVRRIVALRGEDLTVRAIAEALDAEGVSSRSGKPWSPSVVARVVRRAERGVCG